MQFIKYLPLYFLLLMLWSCKEQKTPSFESKVVYQSDILEVRQIAEHTYQHISFLKTDDFGNVSCNGMIVTHGDEAIVFDTPTNNASSDTLIYWITNTLQKKVKSVIATHFHEDCIGGLQAFHKQNIPSHASFKTIALSNEAGRLAPQHGFEREKKISVGKSFVDVTFFGEGHTKDNTVGYFPKDKVLFGGCLIKEMGASKGYLGDSNVAAWSKTVGNIKLRYPHIDWVVPGHGLVGGPALLDYTIQLFEK